MRVFLTTISIRRVLVRSVFTVFGTITDQRLKQALGPVLANKLHVASTQRVCRCTTETNTQNDSSTYGDFAQHNQCTLQCILI